MPNHRDWVVIFSVHMLIMNSVCLARAPLPAESEAKAPLKSADHYSIRHPAPGYEDWSLMRESIPDLWQIERIECRGHCPDVFKTPLKNAKNAPQSFSDPTRRVQYDFVECPGQMGLWMHSVPVEAAVKRANLMVAPKFRTNAKGWGFAGKQVNKGFVVCFEPDGTFNKLFTLIDYQGDRMIGYVMDGFVVHYKAVPAKSR